MKREKRKFIKMNRDVDAHFLKNGEVIYANNLRLGSGDDFDDETATTVLSIKLLEVGTTPPLTLPIPYNPALTTDTYKGYGVGCFEDVLNNQVFYCVLFVSNEHPANVISYVCLISNYNGSDNTEPVISALIKDIGNIFLKFDVNFKVTSFQVYNQFAFFCDGLNEMRYFNWQLALGSYQNTTDPTNTAYYPYNTDTLNLLTDLEQLYSVAKMPPLDPPQITYPEQLLNAEDNKSPIFDLTFQFQYSWVYWDRQESALSPFSNVFAPQLGGNPSNYCNVTVDTGSEIVVEINIYAQTEKGDVYLWQTIDKSQPTTVPSDSTITAQFFNNGTYSPFEETQEDYDVPRAAKALEIIDDSNGNAILLGANYLDNFSPVITNMGAIVTYIAPTNFGGSWINTNLRLYGLYKYGIIYYDKFGRRGNVNRQLDNENENLTFPNSVSTNAFFVECFQDYTINQFAQVIINISHLSPSWAVKYSLAITKCLNVHNFMVGYANIVNTPSAGITPNDNDEYTYPVYQIQITDPTFFSFCEIGFKVQFSDMNPSNTGGVIESAVAYEIINIDAGQQTITFRINQSPAPTYTLGSQVWAYVFEPYRQSENELYYESGVFNDIDPTTHFHLNSLSTNGQKSQTGTGGGQNAVVALVNPTAATIGQGKYFDTYYYQNRNLGTVNYATLTALGGISLGETVADNLYVTYGTVEDSIVFIGVDTIGTTISSIYNGRRYISGLGNDNSIGQLSLSGSTTTGTGDLVLVRAEGFDTKGAAGTDYFTKNFGNVQNGIYIIVFNAPTGWILVEKEPYNPLKHGDYVNVIGPVLTSASPTYPYFVGDTLYLETPSPIILGSTSQSWIQVPSANMAIPYPMIYYGSPVTPTQDIEIIDQADNTGRANTFNPYVTQERLIAGIKYSQVTELGTNINGFNQFLDASFNQYDSSFGSIQKLYYTNKILDVYQEKKVGFLYVNVQYIQDTTGNNLNISSANVLNEIRYYNGQFGIGLNPESFAIFGTDKYFCDVNRGSVCRLAQDGIVAISEYGMRNFFNNTFKWCIDSSLNSSFNNQPFYLFGCYNRKFNSYELAINGAQFGLEPFIDATKDIICPSTLSFNDKEQIKGWTSFYSFLPQMMCSLGQRIVSFSNGQPFIHEANDSGLVTYCQFYTSQSDQTITQYDGELDIAFNENPDDYKSYKIMGLNSNQAWSVNGSGNGVPFFPALNGILTSIGQSSSLLTTDFLQTNNEFIASFLRDQNTPNFASQSLALINGDTLKGDYIRLNLLTGYSTFATPNTTKVKLSNVSVGYEDLEFTYE